MSLNPYLVGLLRGSFCGGGVGGGGEAGVRLTHPHSIQNSLGLCENLEIWYKKTHILTDI